MRQLRNMDNDTKKTKEEWEKNLEEFRKMLEDNSKNIEQVFKTREELQFFIEKIEEKLNSMN